MNDLDEVKFGVLYGVEAVKRNEEIRAALKTEARHKSFTEYIDYYIDMFEDEHLLDTYVFCLSEHEPENTDGMLSMWRGYGGNDKGAALVFDTSRLNANEDNVLMLGRVKYGSGRERFHWFEEKSSILAKILSENHIPDDRIYLASEAILERIKLFALFTKHHGFKEEQEWRVVYMSDRDRGGKLAPMQHYLNGPRGVEPKLRFKREAAEGVARPDFSIDKILASILLGPSTSSALAVRSVARMLDLIGKPELKTRLIASSIPLRST